MGGLTRYLGSGLDFLWGDEEDPSPLASQQLLSRLAREKEDRLKQERLAREQEESQRLASSFSTPSQGYSYTRDPETTGAIDSFLENSGLYKVGRAFNDTLSLAEHPWTKAKAALSGLVNENSPIASFTDIFEDTNPQEYSREVPDYVTPEGRHTETYTSSPADERTRGIGEGLWNIANTSAKGGNRAQPQADVITNALYGTPEVTDSKATRLARPLTRLGLGLGTEVSNAIPLGIGASPNIRNISPVLDVFGSGAANLGGIGGILGGIAGVHDTLPNAMENPNIENVSDVLTASLPAVLGTYGLGHEFGGGSADISSVNPEVGAVGNLPTRRNKIDLGEFAGHENPFEVDTETTVNFADPLSNITPPKGALPELYDPLGRSTDPQLDRLKQNAETRTELDRLAKEHGVSNPKSLNRGFFHNVFETDNPDTVLRASNLFTDPSEIVPWPDSAHMAVQPIERSYAGGKKIDVLPRIKEFKKPTAEQFQVLKDELAAEGKYSLEDPTGTGNNVTVNDKGKAVVVDPGALVPIDVVKKKESFAGKSGAEAEAARAEYNRHIRGAIGDLDALEGNKSIEVKPNEEGQKVRTVGVNKDESNQGYKSNFDEVESDLLNSGLMRPDELRQEVGSRASKEQLPDLDEIYSNLEQRAQTARTELEAKRSGRSVEGALSAKDKRSLGLKEDKPVKVDELFDPNTGELLNELPNLEEPKTKEQLIQESLNSIRTEGNKGPVELATETGQGNGNKPPRIPPIKTPKEPPMPPGGSDNPANPTSASKSERSTFDMITDVPKELKSSLDVSFPFRQGLFLLNRPAALKGMGRGLKNFFSEKGHLETRDYLENKWTNKDLAKNSGLAQVEYDPTQKTNTSEEFGWQGLGRVPGIKHSERSFIDSGNLVRANMFDEFVKKNPDKSPEFYKGVSDYLNTLTGRTPLPKSISKLSNIANKAMWSPRFVASRVQLLNPVFYVKLPPEIQKAALRDVVGTLGAAALMTGSIKAIGDAKGDDTEIGTDPRQGNFGYVRVGKTSYNLFAGLSPLVKLYTRLATGQTKDKSGKVTVLSGFSPGSALGLNEDKDKAPFDQTVLGEVGRFARGKESPALGTIHNLLEGKDFLGQQYNATDVPESLGLPLSIEDFISAFRQGGLEEALKTLPGLAGVGVQVQKPLAKDKKKKVKKKSYSSSTAYPSIF